MTHKILDLFSGLGGFSLGLERTGHFKTIAFCDNDKFSKLILDKHWKGVKIYDDVREITKEKFKEDGIPFPDIITGGFPCQPFSVAGKQKGTSDDRHLWPEMFRIIKAFKPRYVIGENVRGIINIQDGVVFETVCTDLESEGYEVQPFIIPAAGVGAPHRRERVWIVAVRSNVVNTVGNDEGREISRSDEETRRIQEEHRTEHSATRQSSRTSSVRQSNDGHEDVEDSRRTLQQETELREKNEDEVGERYANQHQRSGSPSESNVANTERERLERLNQQSTTISGKDERTYTRNESSRDQATGTEDVANANINGAKRNQPKDRQGSRTQQSSEDVANTESIESNVGGLEQRQRERSGQREVGGASGSTNVADTVSERGRSRIAERQDAEDVRQPSQSSNTGWWDFEPNVGRVAHGVSGRVHRLKGLGNSIVPQIAEEIGKALIKAERE